MRHAYVAIGEIILADEHGDDARTSTRGRRVDRYNSGVGVGRAHEHGIRLIRQRDVVGVIAAPAHEAQILEARHRPADERPSGRSSAGRIVDPIHSVQTRTGYNPPRGGRKGSVATAWDAFLALQIR